MSNKQYYLFTFTFTLLFSCILFYFSYKAKEIFKNYSEIQSIIAHVSISNNYHLIDDTVSFRDHLFNEFSTNKIDDRFIKLFFSSEQPSNFEIIQFLLFYKKSMQEFPATLYSYRSNSNTVELSIILTYSEDVIIKFVIINNDNKIYLKNIFGLGKIMKKIQPIILNDINTDQIN